MSKAMNPTSAGDQPFQARTRSQPGRGAPVAAQLERPGLVTFAAIMMFVAAGFAVVWAILELTGAGRIKSGLASDGYSNLTGYLWAWAVLDLILAAVAIYAGIDVLRGGAIGLAVGLVMAGVSAVRWFFYLPAAPWTALAIIAVDVLIIYGLVANAEYFANAQS
jgi:hypothetical protein